MDLRGRIDLFGVADTFRMLHQAGATGKLVLTGPAQRARVYFHRGDVVYARTDARRERLGEYLVRIGALDPAQLEGAKMKAGLAKGRRIGSILVESGSIDAEQLRAAITQQIKETVYSLMRMEEGSFAFYSQIFPENEDILLDVGMDLLLREGLRHLDEVEGEA